MANSIRSVAGRSYHFFTLRTVLLVFFVCLSYSIEVHAQKRAQRSVVRRVKISKKIKSIAEEEKKAQRIKYDSLVQAGNSEQSIQVSDSFYLKRQAALASAAARFDWQEAKRHADKVDEIIRVGHCQLPTFKQLQILSEICELYADFSSNPDLTEKKYLESIAFSDTNRVHSEDLALLIFNFDNNILSVGNKYLAKREALLDSAVQNLDDSVHPNLCFRLKVRHCATTAEYLSLFDQLKYEEEVMSYGLSKSDSIFPNLLALHAFNTANVYLKNNEDERALVLLDLAIYQLNRAIANGKPKQQMYRNLAYVISRKIEGLLRLERYQEAYESSDYAFSLAYSLEPAQPRLLKFLHADRFMILQANEATELYESSLDSLEKYNLIDAGKDDSDNFQVYKNLGIKFYNCRKFRKAQYYLQEAFEFKEDIPFYLHALLGQCKLENNLFDETQQIELSLDYVTENFDKTSFRNLRFPLEFIYLLYTQTNDQKYFDQLTDLIDYLFDERLDEYIHEANNKFNQEHIHTIYDIFELLLAIHNDIGNLSPERLYQIHNNARGLDLWKDQINQSKWSIDRLPQKIVETYRALVDRKLFLSDSIKTFGIDQTDSVNLVRLKMFQVDDSIKQLQEKFNPISIPFSSLIMDRSFASSVTDILNPNEYIISYWMGANHLHVLMQSKDEFFEYSTSADSVNKYADLLAHAFKDRQADYRPFARALYELLFQPFDKHIHDSAAHLVIFPDHSLHTLPFDVLLDKNNSHLIEKYSISIESSIKRYLLRNEHNKRPLEADLIAFAPDYQDDDLAELDQHAIALLTRSGPYHLPGAQREADQIADAWNGRSIVGKAANKSNFSNLATSGSIMHLAMHAVLDESNHNKSYLHFSTDSIDGQLTGRDIQKLKIDAPFITLSACNTGVGKTHQGTGARSIARGFLSAGVPSLLMSLWRVPDESTSEIMINLYKHLSSGTPKHLALQQAKLDYIKDVQDPQLGHPYYWAGFTLYGDTQAIVPKPYFNPVLIGIVAGLLGLLAFGLLRRKAS